MLNSQHIQNLQNTLQNNNIVILHGPSKSGKYTIAKTVLDAMNLECCLLDMETCDIEEIIDLTVTKSMQEMFGGKGRGIIIKNPISTKLINIIEKIGEYKDHCPLVVLTTKLIPKTGDVVWLYMNMPTKTELFKWVRGVVGNRISANAIRKFIEYYDNPCSISVNLGFLLRTDRVKLNVNDVESYNQKINQDKFYDIKEQLHLLSNTNASIEDKACGITMQTPNWVWWNARYDDMNECYYNIENLSKNNVFHSWVIEKHNWTMYNISNYICNMELKLTESNIKSVQKPKGMLQKPVSYSGVNIVDFVYVIDNMYVKMNDDEVRSAMIPTHLNDTQWSNILSIAKCTAKEKNRLNRLWYSRKEMVEIKKPSCQ